MMPFSYFAMQATYSTNFPQLDKSPYVLEELSLVFQGTFGCSAVYVGISAESSICCSVVPQGMQKISVGSQNIVVALGTSM